MTKQTNLKRSTLISIKQLQHQYKGAEKPALNSISLDIQQGSVFGLLGPNGAGKTTLLSILSGLVKCAPNKVFINGQDLSKNTKRLKTFSIVPQEYAFYNRLSVIENLTFFAGALGIAREKIETQINSAATATGLLDRLTDKAENLSGGLKRRLNLAIGLLNQPTLLLLDEPTVGIDPHSRNFILETIKTLNEQGTTIIYTSHYMEEVEAICTDIAIIDDGSVLLKGPLDELLCTENNTLEIDLKEPLSQLQTEQLNQLSVTSDASLRATQQHLKFTLNTEAELLSVLTHFNKHLIKTTRIHYGIRNLEDLFLNLTSRSLRD